MCERQMSLAQMCNMAGNLKNLFLQFASQTCTSRIFANDLLQHHYIQPDMGQYQIFVQYQYQYFLKFGFQNQYQYQNSSKSFFNIKININIKIFPNSISKSISKFFKVKNQYQNQHQYCQNIDLILKKSDILEYKLHCIHA